MIHVGFSKGRSVDIPLLHTIVAAQTRYGKSTTIRAMMQYIPDDFKVVCLDVKDPRDFQGAGVEIPIYIENKTDPLMLKQLLEQQSHLWLRREFPELIDLCKEGDTFEKVYERVKARMEEKVHPVVRDRLKVLRLLLKTLTEDMAKTELSDTLELPEKINVMNLSKAPGEIKQLSVYSVVKWVLKKLRNVITVIDELPDFAPQQYRTPSKNMIGQAIRKGGAKGNWLWLSGQTMTGVDKQVLKQAMIWILGHQREINEAKRTLEQIPFKTGLKVEDIMTLPVGHFVVCTDEGAYITYVQPEGVIEDVARQVSLQQISVNSVVEALKSVEEDDDLVFKEKYEEEKKLRERAVETLSLREAEMGRVMKRNDELALEVEQLRPLKELRNALLKILPADLQGFEPGTSEVIELQRTTTILEASPAEKTVKVSDETIRGKLVTLAKTGFFGKWQGLGDVHKALIEKFGWNISKKSLNTELSRMVNEFVLGCRKDPSRKQKVYHLSANVKFKEAQ